MSGTHDYENDDRQTEKFRKLFIGGLTSNTTEEILRQHFEQWGEVVYCTVKRNRETMNSRGFGFLIYQTAAMLDDAQRNRPHVVDNKKVDTRRATPRNELHMAVNKIFVGGLKHETTEEDIKEAFSVFGKIKKVDVVKDKDTGKQKGFCFLTFEDLDSVDKCVLVRRIPLSGQYVQIKRAIHGGRETSGGIGRNGNGHGSPINLDCGDNGYGYPGNQVYPVNGQLVGYPGYYGGNWTAYGFGPSCIGIPYGYDLFGGYNFGFGYSIPNLGAQFIRSR